MIMDNEITSILKDIGTMIGNLPNVVSMSDDRALRFADLSSALSLSGIYLDDFRTTGCMSAARKWLDMSIRTSNELAALATGERSREVGQALIVAQQALVEAHTQFIALVTVRLAGACAPALTPVDFPAQRS
jgi:hypothetical protein